MKHIFLLLLLFTFFANCYSQNQKFNINYYSARDYGKGLEATNQSCVQDKMGILYFGNAGVIIKFDGVNWTQIPVKQQSTWILSLAVSDNNYIYVGAQNEFGLLKPNSKGKLVYVSLSDKLSKEQKVFTKINRVLTWKNNVAFQSEEAVYLYSNNKLTTILPETSFHLSFIINDELYIRQRNIGIMKLVNNKLQLIKGTEFYKNFGVFSILENSDKTKLIIMTREDGFWLFDCKTYNSTPILSSDCNLLKQYEIYGAIKLSDGNIAINTLNNGIIITNEQLKILNKINHNNGLKDNGVLALMQDFQGNLWAGLNNGISQIQYSLPISSYSTESGILGNITSILRYNSKLFVGSTNGLFIQSETNNESLNLVPYHDFTKGVKKMCKAFDFLILGTQDGLFGIKNNTIKKIDDTEVNAVYYSNYLKILFVAGKNSLIIYEYSGSWKKLLEINEVSEEIIRFEEEQTSNGSIVWMGTALQGMIRLKYTSITNYKIDKFNSNDGLIDNAWTIPFKIDNKVVFSQRKGLMQFVNEESIIEQLPDSLKNNPEFYKGYFDYYNFYNQKERINLPFYLIEDAKNRFYVNLDGEIGYFDKTNLYSWVTQQFCLADIGKANVFFHDDDGICWIGGDDGLLRFDENKVKNYSIDFCSILNKVTCGLSDSIIYDGYSESYYNKSNNFNIDYKLNTVGFNFSAPFFEGTDKILYSYMLVGQDTSYSSWNSENHVLFTNLWEGNYIFKVRAKNAYGHISSESSFKFSILSPWYRKYWAYFIYLVVLIVIILIIVRLNSQRLIAKNKKLEKIILERTYEIHEKNIELQIQKEEILDSINYARRIQKAVLPDYELSLNGIGEHFIILKPKDIVSGDFYWTAKMGINNNEHLKIFTVADCTGHGVPGAFMSMLCISLLNEVVLKEGIVRPDEILNKVRELIIQSLKQKGISGEQKDGMDICFCVYNNNTHELQYSGANNPLYIVRNKNKESIIYDKQLEQNDLMLYEIKGDAMPIAIYEKMKPFTLHTVKMLDDDRIYLFSDGFADQFGGTKGKKFMYKNFKIALMETQSSEMENQKTLLDKQIEDWKACINSATNSFFEQVDDICVMGVKV